MRRISMIVGLGMVAVTATGCTKKLRVTKYPDGYELGHYAGDGGVVLIREAEKGENGQQRAICVAPPSQAATTIKVEAQNGVKATIEKVEVGVDTNNKVEESLHSLYEQGQATLYIQFMAYRLCEATLNGWIDQAQYEAKLADIMSTGQRLIEIELNREKEDSKQSTNRVQAAQIETLSKALSRASAESLDAPKAQELQDLSLAQERAREAEARRDVLIEREQTRRRLIEALTDPNIDEAARDRLQAEAQRLLAQ